MKALPFSNQTLFFEENHFQKIQFNFDIKNDLEKLGFSLFLQILKM